MIRLRLQRRGRKKRPYFHIVAADQRFPRDGRVIERLGRYDNVSENKQLTLDEERVIHWLRVGAQPSDTVRSLLKREGILYKLHLIRWGKSEEEIEAALEEWRTSRSSEEDATSRREQQKSLLEAEAKEYKKLLEEKAAEAAREAEAARLEAEKAEAEAEAEKSESSDDAPEETAAETTTEAAEEIVAEETEKETKAETEAEEVPEAEAAKEEEAEAEAEVVAEEEPKAEEEKEEAKPKANDSKKDNKKVEQTEAVTVSTDMNANEAIDHIKNTPLDQLEGFVTEAEDRVTVQRAWESKKGEA